MKNIFLSLALIFSLKVSHAAEGSFVYTDVAITTEVVKIVAISSTTATIVSFSTNTSPSVLPTGNTGNAIIWFSATMQNPNSARMVYKLVPYSFADATPPSLSCSQSSSNGTPGTIIPGGYADNPGVVTEETSSMKIYALYCGTDATANLVVTQRGR